MEYQALNESARMMANDKRRSIYINKVKSGLPRWLIEIGFVLYVVQALYTEGNISKWVIGNGLQVPMSMIILVSDMILFCGVMRGMKTLIRPFTLLWWIFIIVIAAGDIAFADPDSFVNLALAVATPLVYLPLGFAITFFYRGWLQWVGILMIAHMVTMIVLPIMLFDIVPFIVTDIIGVITQVALGWMMRKVLI
jgi:hypothetical protein